MGVDLSKKRLGLKTGVEKGMFRPEIRSGVGLSLKYHTSPLPNPWGTRGRESQTIYPKEQSRSRARATGEQRSREEQRRKPKEKIFTLSSPIPPPYYQQFAL